MILATSRPWKLPTILCGVWQMGRLRCSKVKSSAQEVANEDSHSVSELKACVLGHHEVSYKDWDGILVFLFIM